MNFGAGDSPPEVLGAFNPILSSFHEQLVEERIAVARQFFIPRNQLRRLALLQLRVQTNWLELVLWFVSTLLLVMAIAIFTFS